MSDPIVTRLDKRGYGGVGDFRVSASLEDAGIVVMHHEDGEPRALHIGMYGPHGITLYVDRENLTRLRDTLTAALERPTDGAP